MYFYLLQYTIKPHQITSHHTKDRFYFIKREVLLKEFRALSTYYNIDYNYSIIQIYFDYKVNKNGYKREIGILEAATIIIITREYNKTGSRGRITTY